MFNLIAGCLDRGALPVTSEVLEELRRASEWPPCTQNYINAVGSPRADIVANMAAVVERSRDHDSKAGSDEFVGWDFHKDNSFDERIRNMDEARLLLGFERGQTYGDDDYEKMALKAKEIGRRRLQNGEFVLEAPYKGPYFTAYEALPECRNDSEFGMIQGVLEGLI